MVVTYIHPVHNLNDNMAEQRHETGKGERWTTLARLGQLLITQLRHTIHERIEHALLLDTVATPINSAYSIHNA